eukprot:jgi/Psemu1/26024/gm1.26024_g
MQLQNNNNNNNNQRRNENENKNEFRCSTTLFYSNLVPRKRNIHLFADLLIPQRSSKSKFSVRYQTSFPQQRTFAASSRLRHPRIQTTEFHCFAKYPPVDKSGIDATQHNGSVHIANQFVLLLTVQAIKASVSQQKRRSFHLDTESLISPSVTVVSTAPVTHTLYTICHDHSIYSNMLLIQLNSTQILLQRRLSRKDYRNPSRLAFPKP